MFGPFDTIPDQRAMQTSCLEVVFPLYGYQIFYLLPQEIGFFGPKTAKFGPKLAGSFGALVVGGCSARAVYRKTPAYFIFSIQN